MAEELLIGRNRERVKLRSPWAVALLPFITLGIYHLVWWYRINREMRDLGQSLTATIAVGIVAFGTFDALSFNMAAGLTFLFLGCTGAALRLLKAQGAQADAARRAGLSGSGRV